jgi:predicted phage-related endonuclease
MTTAIAPHQTWKILTDRPPGTPEWKAAHKGKIGSNDVASIFNVNPHKSAVKLWGELCEHTETEDISHLPHIRRGILLEPVVVSLFENETGMQASPSPGLVQHPTLDYVAITPDRMLDVAGALAPLECKTVGLHKRKTWSGDIPRNVHVQGLAQCWVLGLAIVYFAGWCLDAEPDEADDEDLPLGKKQDPLLLWGKREFDAAQGEVLGHEVTQFWENHVLKDTPPDPKGDLKALKAIYPKHAAGMVKQLAAEMEIKILRNKELAAVKTASDKEQKILKAELLAELGEAEYGETPGGLVVRARTQSGGNYFVEPFTSRPLIMVKKVGA